MAIRELSKYDEEFHTPGPGDFSYTLVFTVKPPTSGLFTRLKKYLTPGEDLIDTETK